MSSITGASVTADKPLMEMGLDSLNLTALQSQLQDTFGISLPGTFVFDYPTVADEAKFVVQSMTKTISKDQVT